MDKRKENGITLVPRKMLKYRQKDNIDEESICVDRLMSSEMNVLYDKQFDTEVVLMDKETELYNAVYKEISEIVGLDATLKIYLRFKGQQISFPVWLYNPNMIQQKVIKEFDGIVVRWSNS